MSKRKWLMNTHSEQSLCETQADEDEIKEVLAENAAVDADIA